MFQASDAAGIALVLSVLAAVAAVVVVVIDRLRSATLFLWICGMAVGGVYLSFGAEYLAVVQWILSTLAALSFIFYSILFGEEQKKQERWMWPMASILVGIGLVLVLTLNLRDLSPAEKINGLGTTLALLGRTIISEHFLALKVLIVALLVVGVGAGILSRPETEGEC